MIAINKRASYWPSFFLLPALLFALLTSIFSSYLNYFAGIALLLMLLCFRLPNRITWSPLSLCLFAYGLLVTINLLFIDSTYQAVEFYYLGYLIIGFIVFQKLEQQQILFVHRLLLYFFVLLAAWGIIQFYTGSFYIVEMGSRANALFYTPNTFAAAINLMLFPLIAAYIGNYKNKKTLLSLILFLFFALLTTRSRGGWISFVLGMLVLIYLHRIYFSEKTKHFFKLGISLLCTCLLFVSSQTLNFQSLKQTSLYQAVNNAFSLQAFESVARTKNLQGQSNRRAMLYSKTWNRIKEKPFAGHGYNNFQYYWLKDQELPFKNNHTDFVHNDYLQIWMETGLLALLAICTMIAFFYYKVWKHRKAIIPDDQRKTVIIGTVAGLTAFFSHAMVDFLFYPCFLALLFSAYLAMANRLYFGQADEDL